MANVVIEHISLLVPVFFTMMVFTLIATAIVTNYSSQQRAIVVESAKNQLTTTISQLYYTVSLAEIPPCTVTKTFPLPGQIDGQNYMVNGALHGNVLALTFTFSGISVRDTAYVNLGPGVHWDASSVLDSNNVHSVIMVKKDAMGGVWLSFR